MTHASRERRKHRHEMQHHAFNVIASSKLGLRLRQKQIRAMAKQIAMNVSSDHRRRYQKAHKAQLQAAAA